MQLDINKESGMKKYVNTGNGPGTAIAVLMVGLMAIAIVFSVLGGGLYMHEDAANESALSKVPARAVLRTIAQSR